ncbi:hypothetical protein BT93_L3980 [Corymbia citriodora subsp. variegata]|uniref:Dirigent protein n=1 Tax=Corymbia citriodora subsp. variegata TaxID=360336 RepID=A0A8T0CHG6_CORYI|nr:hypothetical protein BT93_L3980 [Corymbia citriodora subsp. variegata]
MRNISHNFFFIFVLLFTLQHAFVSKTILKEDRPCKRFVLFLHDKLFNGTNAANAMSAAVTEKIDGFGHFFFGKIIVFNDPATGDRVLVFNSTEHRGTLNIMGADIIADKVRFFSLVGDTGDFFMTRGIVAVELDSFEGLNYTFI